MDLKKLRSIAHGELSKVHSNISDFRVEQLEQEPSGDWNMVVSYLLKNFNQIEQRGFTGLGTIHSVNLPFERVYKRVVLKEDGTFKKLLIFKDDIG